MGKKNKSKNKANAKEEPAVVVQESSEADAAAGLMVAEALNQPTKKSTMDPKEEKSNGKRKDLATKSKKDEEEEPLSRRQKRQKLNEKNKWPQHPKIMNPEKRAKAYLRVAGVQEIDDNETNVPVEKSPVKKKGVEEDDEWRRFGRFLGGTDARTRHKAVKRLGHYLQAKSGFGQEDIGNVVGLSELDLMKLWKGLWYTLYMADKNPVQEELAKHLSKLIWCLTGSVEEDEQAGQAYLDLQVQEELEELELQRQIAESEDGEEGSDGSSEEGDDEEDHGEDFKILHTRHVEMDDDDEDSSEEEEEEDSNEEEEEGSEDEDEDSEDGSSGTEEDENMEDRDDIDDDEEKFIRGVPLVMLMIKTFFKTLVREWGNMDKYRVDKFYTLMRYTMREMYRYMATRQWNLGIIKLLNDTIVDEALTTPPNGIRYHLIDISLEELSYIVHKETDSLPLAEAIFLEVMEPFFGLAQHGAGEKSVQGRALENILEKFLKQYSIVSEVDGQEETQKEKQILDDVHVGTVAEFIFEMASDENTLDIHRKSLYDMHKQYKRQLKKVGKDVEIHNLKLDQEEEEQQEDMDEENTGDVVGMQAEEDSSDSLDELATGDNDALESSDDDDEEEEEDNFPSKKVKKAQRDKKRLNDGETSKIAKEHTLVETKEKKKKKGNRELMMDWTRHGDDDVAGDDKKDKKKNKGIEKKNEMEETVTISMSDQKKAKKALQTQQELSRKENEEKQAPSKSPKREKKKKNKGKTDEEKEKERRVSWNTKNTARSWKKSMQGLKTMKPPKVHLSSKTPDKSILLNKGKKSPSNTEKKQRKRAVDYF